MQGIEQKTLSFFGEDFEKKVVYVLMTDHKYFESMESAIDQNMFGEAVLREWVGQMKDYYRVYNTVPNFTTMRANLRKRSRSEIDMAMYDAIVDEIKGLNSEDSDYTKDTVTEFFKRKYVVSVANKVKELAIRDDLDNLDAIQELLGKASSIGQEEFEGVQVADNLNKTLSEDSRIPIPTGIEKIDDILEGGVGKGELMLIGGPSGFGKTTITTSIAQEASLYKCKYNDNDGYKVLQIFFEDREEQIRRKHLGKFCNIEAREITRQDKRERINQTLDIERKDEFQMFNSNLRLLRLPSGEITAWQLEKIIKRHINAGFNPDLIIIDYFECLDNPRNSALDKWELEGKTMRKIESMAYQMNKAFIVATQGTKDSFNTEVLTQDKLGGSVKKTQVAHIILTIARTNEDIAENKATLAIMKNRSGRSGQSFPDSYFNNGTCTINTDNASTIGSLFDYDQMKISQQQQVQASVGISAALKQQIAQNKGQQYP